MRAYIANTDYEWYRFFLGRPDIDEVNFWRPGTQPFAALAPGEPFLFRLKSPYNAIAGAAFFVHFSIIPASLAWVTFEEKNGATSEEAMLGSRPTAGGSISPSTTFRTTGLDASS